MKLNKTLFLACLCSCFGCLAHAQMQWKNPLQESFPTVQGRWWQDELKDSYHRFPPRCKGVLPDGAWYNSMHSAGLTIMFRSNSPRIHVRYTTGQGNRQMYHMPSTGSSGLDLYATDRDGNIHWVKGNMSSGDTITFRFEDITYNNINKEYGYEYELYLPLYIEVTWMEIGVDEGCQFSFLPVSREAPIVFYGTSIAHGGCASRPGLAWQTTLRREMGNAMINLGFSGSGKLEDPVFGMLSEIPARLFVIDCMPNMTGLPDSIVPRILRGVNQLRRKSQVPILLVEHSGYPGEYTSSKRHDSYQRTNDRLKEAFERLTAEHIPGIYYMTKEELGLKEDDTMDGTHPNDLGMRHMADGYKKKLAEVMNLSRTSRYPCTQQRDYYDWRARHEEVLRMGQEGKDFDVVMIGNSITHFWSGEPKDNWHRGDDSWKKLFGKLHVLNMGFGWDRTENLIWRLNHGELDGFKARKIVLMIGTNDISAFPKNASVVDEDVMEVVAAIRQHQPEAEIYVQAIYPRRTELDTVKSVNACIQQKVQALRAGGDQKLHFIDPGRVLLDETGEGIREELYTGDGLHPGEKGYRLIGEKLKGYLGL